MDAADNRDEEDEEDEEEEEDEEDEEEDKLAYGENIAAIQSIHTKKDSW